MERDAEQIEARAALAAQPAPVPKGRKMAIQQKTAMPALERALDAESYEWLATNQPDILTAIEIEIANGHTPEQIKWRVLRRTNRFEIAMRCEQAARHVASVTN